MIISFIGFLLIFTLIGVSSAWKSKGTKQDYYLASGSVKPWLVGLSAVATNNSGYMFIGIIGYVYVTGLASIWLMIGWIAGDFMASMFVHSRLKSATTRTGEVSYAGVLSNWYGGHNSTLQRLIGGISLLFLLAYASAQLVAGSKALHVLLDWPTWVGAVVGAVLVTLYCFAGGIRASIWTDAAQSIVMIFAMALMLVTVTLSLGGIDGVILKMEAVDGFLALFPRDLVIPGLGGGLLFAISWIFAGLSVIGQPHIMVRFMALKDNNMMRRARIWYYLWFFAFYLMAIGVGMLSRVYLTDVGAFDAELALPTMAQQLLPPVLVGLILAGIFAATMSTADSLVLSCSAAITHDLLPHKIENTTLIKLMTVLITLGALGGALMNSQSVFSLVVMAWSGLASAFAPLLIILSLGKHPGRQASIIAIFTGLGVALLWRYLGWHNAIYEGLPGILSGLMVLGLALLASSGAAAPSSPEKEARSSE
ncbi:sodium/proline symporter [Paremcibacter congregatus]|uniref:Sodium/proline symporter n=1 Tax=Paremcibacter congregatus TaxID=2043170 RepID=A0A2G4YQI5_9PROT|nr:sodium/proline symporter [Paremcibacter congregatus]PHZ84582.1 sodium:proline symporter [Paremcibacter congregatus]QDE28802.1 sodium/proline symporter [Paremcibacter congregatus]